MMISGTPIVERWLRDEARTNAGEVLGGARSESKLEVNRIDK